MSLDALVANMQSLSGIKLNGSYHLMQPHNETFIMGAKDAVTFFKEFSELNNDIERDRDDNKVVKFVNMFMQGQVQHISLAMFWCPSLKELGRLDGQHRTSAMHIALSMIQGLGEKSEYYKILKNRCIQVTVAPYIVDSLDVAKQLFLSEDSKEGLRNYADICAMLADNPEYTEFLKYRSDPKYKKSITVWMAACIIATSIESLNSISHLYSSGTSRSVNITVSEVLNRAPFENKSTRQFIVETFELSLADKSNEEARKIFTNKTVRHLYWWFNKDKELGIWLIKIWHNLVSRISVKEYFGESPAKDRVIRDFERIQTKICIVDPDGKKFPTKTINKDIDKAFSTFYNKY